MPDANPRPKTHYDQLGVKPTASPQQIRRAFRDLSKLYHPDTTDLPATEATEKFQQLNEAYAILSSPDRRWTYDQKVGYSRISVMQPLEPLSRPVVPQRQESANMYLDPSDRPLSAGEIFALFILGLTFVACLALVVTVSLTRGDYAVKLETLPTEIRPNVEATLDQQLETEPSVGDTSLKTPSLPEALPSSKSLTSAPPTWL
jgi:curved DNA-binding protein CbpA